MSSDYKVKIVDKTVLLICEFVHGIRYHIVAFSSFKTNQSAD